MIVFVGRAEFLRHNVKATSFIFELGLTCDAYHDLAVANCGRARVHDGCYVARQADASHGQEMYARFNAKAIYFNMHRYRSRWYDFVKEPQHTSQYRCAGCMSHSLM